MKSLWAVLPVVVAVLAGCNRTPKTPVFPESFPPGWTRSGVHALDAAQFPRVVRENGIAKGWEAEYRAADGAVAVVDVYAVPSGAQSLDMVQRWRPERNNAQFPTEHFLLNVAWQGASHDELASLVRSLPKLVEGP